MGEYLVDEAMVKRVSDDIDAACAVELFEVYEWMLEKVHAHEYVVDMDKLKDIRATLVWLLSKWGD